MAQTPETPMQYSPKLKMAMTAIQAIMKQHDIAGVVVLHTPGFGEFFTKIDTTYSGARFVTQGNQTGLHFKVKAAELGGREQANIVAASTANMFQILADNLAPITMMMIEGAEKANHIFQAEHTKGRRSGNEEQNN
jgi:hypothetical protein